MNNQLVEIMRCNIGSHTFGIERNKVQSVQHGNRVRVLSATDEMFEAILRTNEGELPVLRLGDFINEASTLSVSEQRLLILRSSWGLWCLMVDSVSQAEFVQGSAIQPLPKVASNGLASEVYTGEDDVLLMLSPDNIHPNAVTASLAESEINSMRKPPIDWVDATPADKSHLVLFQMPGTESNDGTYAVGLTPKQINEVLRSAALKVVPTSAEFLEGVITWRGRLVPVMNLGKRFGLAKEKTAFKKQDRIVIAHGVDSESLIAFYADANVDVLRLPAPHRPMLDMNQIDPTLMHGAAEYAGQTVIIPHISNLAVSA